MGAKHRTDTGGSVLQPHKFEIETLLWEKVINSSKGGHWATQRMPPPLLFKGYC